MSSVEIRIRDLHKSFTGNAVLAGIDLDIFQGDILAIVGGSGCGKTVLLNHILGQLFPDQGTIEVVNHDDPGEPLVNLNDVGEFEIDSIHKHWGVVFQRNALFSGTVFDNIALWLREVKGLRPHQIRRIATRTLSAVGLDSTRAFMDVPQEKLSGGMAKRLAVARALAMDPFVIFYDEPTTGLDPVTAAQIHNLIHDMHVKHGKRTSIIVTHDKDLLSRLRPRTVMLSAGLVHFDGRFEAFAASDSPIIRPYFDLMPLLQGRQIETQTIQPSERRKGLLIQ